MRVLPYRKRRWGAFLLLMRKTDGAAAFRRSLRRIVIVRESARHPIRAQTGITRRSAHARRPTADTGHTSPTARVGGRKGSRRGNVEEGDSGHRGGRAGRRHRSRSRHQFRSRRMGTQRQSCDGANGRRQGCEENGKKRMPTNRTRPRKNRTTNPRKSIIPNPRKTIARH